MKREIFQKRFHTKVLHFTEVRFINPRSGLRSSNTRFINNLECKISQCSTIQVMVSQFALVSFLVRNSFTEIADHKGRKDVVVDYLSH